MSMRRGRRSGIGAVSLDRWPAPAAAVESARWPGPSGPSIRTRPRRAARRDAAPGGARPPAPREGAPPRPPRARTPHGGRGAACAASTRRGRSSRIPLRRARLRSRVPVGRDAGRRTSRPLGRLAARRSGRCLADHRPGPGRRGAPPPPRPAQRRRTVRQPGEVPIPRTRRPPRPDAGAEDVPGLGMGGAAGRRADRAAAARRHRGRARRSGCRRSAGARGEDPAEERGRDHERDAGEEDHRPDGRSLVSPAVGIERRCRIRLRPRPPTGAAPRRSAGCLGRARAASVAGPALGRSARRRPRRRGCRRSRSVRRRVRRLPPASSSAARSRSRVSRGMPPRRGSRCPTTPTSTSAAPAASTGAKNRRAQPPSAIDAGRRVGDRREQLQRPVRCRSGSSASAGAKRTELVDEHRCSGRRRRRASVSAASATASGSREASAERRSSSGWFGISMPIGPDALIG